MRRTVEEMIVRRGGDGAAKSCARSIAGDGRANQRVGSNSAGTAAANPLLAAGDDVKVAARI